MSATAFPHPYRIEDAVAWIRMAARQHPEVSFAIADATEVIGTIGLGLQSDVNYRSAEIGLLAGRTLLGTGHRHRRPVRYDRIRLRPLRPHPAVRLCL